MHLVCDSYVGFDSTRDVVMKVDESSKAEEVESDEEISEAEEGAFFSLSFLINLRVHHPTPSTQQRLTYISQIR